MSVVDDDAPTQPVEVRGRRRLFLAGAAASVGAIAAAGAATPAHASPTPQEEALGLTNVASYGAVGDGTTVTRTALAAAIAAAGTGGVVYFPPGVYLVDGSLAPLDGQAWIGVQGVSVIKSAGGRAGFTLVEARNVPTSFRMDGLVLDGNRSQTTDPGFKYPTSGATLPGVGLQVLGQPDARQIQVTNSTFRNLWNYGIVVQKFATTGALGVKVSNCRVHDSVGGIALVNVTSVDIDGSTVEDTTQQGIWGQGCQNVMLQNNRSHRNDLHGIVFTYSTGVQIIGNQCVGNGKGPSKFGWGICLGGTGSLSTPNHTISIVGNQCHLNQSGGIVLDPAWPKVVKVHPQRAAITGNVCTSDRVVGINGISTNWAGDLTISGNVVSGFPFHGLNLSFARYTTVTGNVSTGNGRGLVMSSYPAGEDGPYGHGVVSSNMVHDNDVDYEIPDYADGRQIDVAILEPRDQVRIHASKVGLFGVPAVPQPTGWGASNYAETRMIANESGGLGQTNAVLATLINDLKKLGVIGS